MPIPPEHYLVYFAVEDENDIEVIELFNGSQIINVTGGNDSLVILEETGANYYLEVTPIQVSMKHINSFFNIYINYFEMEQVQVYGTGRALDGDDRVYWTTGDTIDNITVTGTFGELPINVSTNGGDDQVYLDGLVGNGSRVYAGDGNDIVRGSSREDIIEGGNGNDVLIGGGGRDILWGGAGSDVFRYTSAQDSSGATGIDTIADFQRGVDKVDLSGVAAFHWIGASPFSGTPGELRGTMLGIQGDINGDRVPDMILWLNAPSYGGLGLTTADFIL